jgi:hypothetical protein
MPAIRRSGPAVGDRSARPQCPPTTRARQHLGRIPGLLPDNRLQRRDPFLTASLSRSTSALFSLFTRSTKLRISPRRRARLAGPPLAGARGTGGDASTVGSSESSDDRIPEPKPREQRPR